MNSENATVLVVDDDPSVRKALARLLQCAGLRVRTFTSAREFLDQGPPAGLGCLLLDVRMPGLSGLDLQDELAKRNIQIPIIFMTGQGDIPMTVRAMKGGATDFLTKPLRDRDLLVLVHEAIKKHQLLLADQAEKTVIQGRIKTLSPREHEVLLLVVKGLMNKEIADALGAALKTVKVHRGRVMHKMQVQSVAELVLAVERVGIGSDTTAPIKDEVPSAPPNQDLRA
jgi:FixJ family two-component response regulator